MPYAPPTITVAGLVIPTYTDILNFLIQNYLSTYGQSVYLGQDSADFQDIAVRALQAADVNSALQAVYLSINPATAIGTSLDLIGKLIGTARRQATSSVATLTLTGTPGAVITSGIAEDVNGNFWNLPASVTIGSGGTASAIATAQNLGNVTANPAAISIIATPTSGWTAVTNAAAATSGEAVEPDSSYRARLLISQAKPSLTLRAGTAAAVAAVQDVTRSVVYENPFGFTAGYGIVDTSGTAVTLVIGYPFDSSDVSQAITISGVTYSISSVGGSTSLTLGGSAGTQNGATYFIGSAVSLGPPHSITAVVEGGSSANIAQAIYDNKNPGVLTNGTTTVTVTDPLNGNISIPIAFDVLGYVQIYVALNVHALTGFTSAVQSEIAASVLLYLDSLGIGESVIFSQLYGAALSAQPNPLQPIFSIFAILSGYATATTATTTIITNPVVSVASATGIAMGQTAVGAGIPPNTTVTLVSGTNITLSNAPTASATVPVTFFTTGTVDIPVAFNAASNSTVAAVVVNLV